MDSEGLNIRLIKYKSIKINKIYFHNFNYSIDVKMKPIHNRKYLEDKRKALRKDLTSAEATLWNHLKQKQLEGRKFRRQHSILNYIVDFYCPKEKLIIELDGGYHLRFEQQLKDYERDEVLNNLGFTIFRIENKFIFEDLDYVLNGIKACFK